LALRVKRFLAGGALVLSLLLLFLGVKRDELRVIWNNGKILCLTCIGIK